MSTTTQKETKSLEKLSISNPKSTHYVDNKKFLEALIDHKGKVNKSVELQIDKPLVSNYLGECFLKIATHLSYKGNFINYTYRDDMISDGIENCLVAVDKFDPAKSSNPFAYYTQIIYYAFIRRIQKEKKQQVTKYKMLENIDLEMFKSQIEGNNDYIEQLIENMKKQMDTIEPSKKEIKKGKK